MNISMKRFSWSIPYRGDKDGDFVGNVEGDFVGRVDGDLVGDTVGLFDGTLEETFDGTDEGLTVGDDDTVRASILTGAILTVGNIIVEGILDGNTVEVGVNVGAALGLEGPLVFGNEVGRKVGCLEG